MELSRIFGDVNHESITEKTRFACGASRGPAMLPEMGRAGTKHDKPPGKREAGAGPPRGNYRVGGRRNDFGKSMIVGSTQRRTVKIRRRGRHASPSQVERVAAQAGKAAPAVVMAGALVAAAPQLQHALASSGMPASAAAQGAHHTVRLTARDRSAGAVQSAGAATLDSSSSRADKSTTARTYVVRSGDTLSAIAQRLYHDAADWQWVYHENDKTVANPNEIYVGERLSVPLNAPAHYTLPYQPRHAKPVTTTVATSTGAASGGASYSGRIGVTDSESSDSRTHPTAVHHASSSEGTTTDNSSSSSSKGWVPPPGNYSCSDLEQLWDAAGGNPGRRSWPPRSRWPSPAGTPTRSAQPTTTACGRSTRPTAPSPRSIPLRTPSRPSSCPTMAATGTRGPPTPAVPTPAVVTAVLPQPLPSPPPAGQAVRPVDSLAVFGPRGLAPGGLRDAQAGGLVGPLVTGVAAVALDPGPLHPVRGHRRDKPLPQIGVLDRLL